MNESLKNKFDSYPVAVRKALLELRNLIFHIADAEGAGNVTESLKWGQPSYSCTGGSPIRIDWSADAPEHLSIFFHCQTSLIATFREVFSDSFTFNGNRELAVPLTFSTKQKELHRCISVALKYHQVKSLPLLGL